jgi:hypothetical protein
MDLAPFGLVRGRKAVKRTLALACLLAASLSVLLPTASANAGRTGAATADSMLDCVVATVYSPGPAGWILDIQSGTSSASYTFSSSGGAHVFGDDEPSCGRIFCGLGGSALVSYTLRAKGPSDAAYMRVASGTLPCLGP